MCYPTLVFYKIRGFRYLKILTYVSVIGIPGHILLFWICRPDLLPSEVHDTHPYATPVMQCMLSVVAMQLLFAVRVLAETGSVARTPRPDFNKYVGLKTFNFFFLAYFANIYISPLDNVVLPWVTFIVLVGYSAYQQIYYYANPIAFSSTFVVRMVYYTLIFHPLMYTMRFVYKNTFVATRDYDTALDAAVVIFRTNIELEYYL